MKENKEKLCVWNSSLASSGQSVRTEKDFSRMDWQKEAIMKLFAGH